MLLNKNVVSQSADIVTPFPSKLRKTIATFDAALAILTRRRRDISKSWPDSASSLSFLLFSVFFTYIEEIKKSEENEEEEGRRERSRSQRSRIGAHFMRERERGGEREREREKHVVVRLAFL